MAATGRQQLLILNLLLHVVFAGTAAIGTMPILLLFVATGTSSRFFALSVLMLVFVVVFWTGTRIFPKRHVPVWGIGIGIAASVLLWGFAFAFSPSGKGDSGSPLVSMYPGDVRVSRFSPTWIVDEADLL